MAITTSTILRAPGSIAFDGGRFYSEGNIQVRLIEDKFDVKADMFPRIDRRPRDRRYEITCKLAGEWEHLSVLFPHGNTALGTPIFDNTPLTIWTRAGSNNKFVFSNVAVTKQPGVVAFNGGVITGDVTFTALLKDGGDPGDADAYLAVSTDTYPTDAFSVAAIKTPVFSASWGAGDLASFGVSESGVVFDFPIELSPQKTDGLGTVQMYLSGRMATAKFTPQGITVAELLTALGANVAMGSAPTINHLNVSGTGVYVRLYNAQLMDPALNFHTQTDMIGEVTAEATQGFTANVTDPLFYVGTSAPA